MPARCHHCQSWIGIYDKACFNCGAANRRLTEADDPAASDESESVWDRSSALAQRLRKQVPGRPVSDQISGFTVGLKYEDDDESNKIEATMVRVFLSPHRGHRFYVRRKALLWDQVMQRLLRRRYVRTGDPKFDALFAVQASRGSRRYVKQFLSDHRRNTLMELQRQVPSVGLGAGRREGIAIGVEIKGRARDNYLTKLVYQLVQAAHEFTN